MLEDPGPLSQFGDLVRIRSSNSTCISIKRTSPSGHMRRVRAKLAQGDQRKSIVLVWRDRRHKKCIDPKRRAEPRGDSGSNCTPTIAAGLLNWIVCHATKYPADSFLF
jgi:hypothetical protein